MSPRVVRFDWDEANIAHIARHDVTPPEVEVAIADPFCYLESSEKRQGQLRYRATGETADGRILTVVFEVRRGRVRPVTAYTAPKKKQAAYFARRHNVDKAPLS